jgi:hypothetical protein
MDYISEQHDIISPFFHQQTSSEEEYDKIVSYEPSVEMTPNVDDCDYSPDELLKIQESIEVMVVDTFE